MFPPLYPILDPHFCSALPVDDLAIELSMAGVELLQLRDKKAPPQELYENAKKLIAALASGPSRVILNDRPDLAAILDAGGVHVGQEDLPVEDARLIVGKSRWVGVSTHNPAQFREAAATSADYIAVGPVFPTATKENPDPVVGIDLLRSVRALSQKPIVAIGGITLESAAEVYEAGADSIAVIRDLCAAPDPRARAMEYLAIARRVRGSRS